MITAKRKKPAFMSDAAVEKRTGKTWPEWFVLLDRAGAKKMTHQQIVAFLVKNHGLGPWWQQMVTVAYEQTRGMRELHQTAKGYQISVSKTLNAPLSEVFDAWHNEKIRRQWLDHPAFEVRKSNKDKSLRISWVDGASNVEVNFYAKGSERCQIVVQHNKLKDAKDAERKKGYWAKQLKKLQDYWE